jgi:hypothetical protein
MVQYLDGLEKEISKRRTFRFELYVLSMKTMVKNIILRVGLHGPPLWSSGQSSWLQIQRSRVRLPALPDFLRSSGSGTGPTQPRKDN